MISLLIEQILGIFGGFLFFSSWLLQAWESRKTKTPIVTRNFFLIRLIACIFLLIESIRLLSFGFILLYAATIVLTCYNLYLCSGKKK